MSTYPFSLHDKILAEVALSKPKQKRSKRDKYLQVDNTNRQKLVDLVEV